MAFAGETHTVWVNPRVTAAMDNLFPIPLTGMDRVNFEILMTITLPRPLDEKRLVKALQDALKLYPHASGRLSTTKDGDWTVRLFTSTKDFPINIVLTKDWNGEEGVPITFANTNDPLDHYKYPAEIPPHISNPITTDVSGTSDPAWDEPLVSIKATETSSCSSTTQLYQGKQLPFGAPTYEKFWTAPPEEHLDNPHTEDFVSRYLQHLRVLYTIQEWVSMVGEVMANTVQVNLLFAAPQIKQLRAIADLWPGHATPASGQDAVFAYLITTLNQCFEVPITRVSSMLSYRGVKNPANLKPDDWRVPGPLALGNTIFQAFTTSTSSVWSQFPTLYGCANLTSRRNTSSGPATAPLSSTRCPTWSDLGLSFTGRSPDMPSFSSHEGDYWMFLRVPTVVRDKFLATIVEDFNSPGFPQNLIRREKLVHAKLGSAKSRL
ncbi:hypothetical protein B0H17DRAFT_1131633 [Mycena rosella]|uniref:Uncharacterized protein n=1 Tax=Mycena rosella TaxID=1033263 RepID=A0AAD7DP21_MYCRO|nr:hypothetical protein B0H17DRAFT_1131633 [Mycena rosella]